MNIAWDLIGRTMLHTLWVGGLVGLAAGAGRMALRRASPEARYVHALACLIVLGLSPLAIGWWLWPEAVRVRPVVETEAAGPASASPAPVPLSIGPPALNALSPAPQTVSYVDRLISVLPYVWMTGTPLTFAVLAFGMIGAERLRRRSRPLTDHPIGERCRVLSKALGLTRSVLVGVCDRVAGPVLIGVVRPMILLPTSALSGWTPEEIEFALLHELIHVKRGDNLVQLIQSLIESFLFFHPAAWVLSAWVRLEREHVCDAAVVARTGNPSDYARALLSLSLLASPSSPPRTGLAMARHHLVVRIQYLLGTTEEPMRHGTLSRIWIGSACLLLLTPALVVLAQAVPSKQPPDAARERALRAMEALAREGAEITHSRVDHLIKIARIRFQAGQADRAKDLLRSAAVIADQGKQYMTTKTIEGVGAADGLTAFAYNVTATGPSTRRLLCSIATEQARIGDRAMALDTLERAARARDTVEGLHSRISSLTTLAATYRALGNAERARSILADIETLAVPTSEFPAMFLIPEVAVAHVAAGEPKRAFAYLDKALADMKTPEERPVTEITAIRSLCTLAAEDPSLVDQDFLRECVKRVDLAKQDNFRASAIEPLAALLASRGDLPQAFRLIDSISDFPSGFSSPLGFRVQALKRVADVLRKAGQAEQATAILDRAIREAKDLRAPSPIAFLLADRLFATRDVAQVLPLIESIPRGDRSLVLALVSRFQRDAGQIEASKRSLAEANADVDYRREHKAEIERRMYGGQEVRGMPATFWADTLQAHRINVLALAGDLAEARKAAEALGGQTTHQAVQVVILSMALDGRFDEALTWLDSAKLTPELRSYGRGEVARLLEGPMTVR